MAQWPLTARLLRLGSPATVQEAKNVLVLCGNTAELHWKISDASLRAAGAPAPSNASIFSPIRE